MSARVNSLRMIFLFTIFPLITSCGKGTTEDVNQRERDREREKSENLFQEFKKAEGIYVGQSNRGRVVVNIQAAWDHDASQGNSTGVPQPDIVGAFMIYPKVSVKGNDPLQVTIPVVSGTYVDVSKNLTLSVSAQDQSNTSMVCHLDDPHSIPCQWFSSRGILDLTLTKSEGPVSVRDIQTQGHYSGRTKELSVDATFQMVLAASPNGRGVQPMISANFMFDDPNRSTASSAPRNNGLQPSPGLPFHSVDGTYDLYSNSLSFIMAGDNPITVNCDIADDASLKCQWHSPEYAEFVLKPVDERPNANQKSTRSSRSTRRRQ